MYYSRTAVTSLGVIIALNIGMGLAFLTSHALVAALACATTSAVALIAVCMLHLADGAHREGAASVPMPPPERDKPAVRLPRAKL